ncbi:MAG TPA: hypothetical protein VK459_22265 [Polyangiaceae bacterium]|nr:hypothetical protein [Polyangiaceae bacterium]
MTDQITRLMMEYQTKLNASTLLVQETCSEEEFQTYRQAVGRATDYMFMELTRAMELETEMSSPDEDEYPDYEGQTAKMLV